MAGGLNDIEHSALSTPFCDPGNPISVDRLLGASIAISLKRIADALHREPGAGLPTFLDQLHGVLSDASHDHAQRMS